MSIISKIIEIKADVSNAAKEIKTLFGDLLDKQVESEKQQQQLNDSVNDIGKAAKNGEKGIKSLANGFKGVGLAIKAVGIGLLIEAFNILKDVFSSNQKVADFFSTTIKSLTIAFNDLFKYIEDHVDGVVKTFKAIFDDPQAAISKLGDLIKENLIERFNSFIDTIGYLGSALKKLFTGDFSGAADDAKKAGKEVVDVFTGVNNTVDRTVEAVNEAADAIAKYAEKTWDAAASMVALENRVKIAIAQNALLIEKYDRLAEQQRQLRDDESLSVEDRIKANDKLGKVLEEQQKLMIKNADLAVKSAQIQYDQNKSVDNYVALIDAQKEKLGVLAQIEGFRSEQIVNRIALQKELNDLNRTGIDGENARLLKSIEFQKVFEKTQLGQLEINAERIKAEQDQIAGDIENKRTLYALGTQARVDAEQDYLNRKQELDQQSLQNDKDIQDERFNLQNEVARKDKEYRENEIVSRQAFEDAKFAVANGGLELVKGLATDSKGLAYAILAVEKGLAAAQVVIEASRSIANQTAANSAAIESQIASASETYPAASMFAVSASIVATNFARLAKGIATTKLTAAASLASILATSITGAKAIAGGGSGGGGGTGGGAGTGSPQAQFNIVGSSGNNQLAATIGAQQNQPVNAYVVGGDVTTQQSLDRNRITNATFL